MMTRAMGWLACILLGTSLCAQPISPVRVHALSCEHLIDSVGIGTATPRLSWKLRSTRRGEFQKAYQVQAASSRLKLESADPDLWDSGKVVSDQSVLVPWAGSRLASRLRVYWRVRIWDKGDQLSDWSEPATFELGLLDAPNEWKGQWITADLPRYDIEHAALSNAFWINAGTAADQAVAVRTVLELPTNVIRHAELRAVGDGLVTIHVNGHAIRQGSSSRTAPLQADITPMLAAGRNVIAIMSAAVRNAVRRDRGERGRNAIIAHATIEFTNGNRLELDTDDSWKGANAPTNDWFTPDFEDSEWEAAMALGRYQEQPSRYVDCTIGPGRYLRKDFNVNRTVIRARLYATALGVYEVTLNGQRIGNGRLDPGWTDYNKRVMVQTFDVTGLLLPGSNTLEAILADGWYAGRVGWMGLAQYGNRPAFAAQLEITYADGLVQVLATDDSWKGGPGEVVGSDFQWGEIIDARRGANWDQPYFEDSGWAPVIVEDHVCKLDPQRGPPVRAVLELDPKTITRRGASWMVDFGQNLVGHVRLAAHGPSGTTIILRHAETLDVDGSLYTENLRPALSTDTFILRGEGREVFEPRFTFHGFRYVEVTGYPGQLTAQDLKGIVVASDTPMIGTWECSDPALNQLYSNILWGQRGNFLSVPTDCPQRDERMGWMGDALVFAPTAVRNANVAGFFHKWMVDVNDAQGPAGDFPNYAPRVAQPQPGWPVWGDAGIVVPWVLYTAYGDLAFLADNYTNMARWLEFNVDRSTDLRLTGGVGDHLAPVRTPVDLVDTAYFANSADIVARAAALLGKPEDAAKYEALHQKIVSAFRDSFLSPAGELKGDTQTAYILALMFDLLPEDLREEAARRLADKVEQTGHLTTGFVGVGLICPALTGIGRSDLAWQLVLNDDYPSWLFSVKNGATTIWERWDGWTPEKGFQNSAMNSFNHYSLGSVGAWLYSDAAGIQLHEVHPGYKHFALRPQFTSRLAWVKSSIDSPYGLISSHWHVENEDLVYEVTVPPNTTAELILPVPPNQVRESGTVLAGGEDPMTALPLAAGTYQFVLPRALINRAGR